MSGNTKGQINMFGEHVNSLEGFLIQTFVLYAIVCLLHGCGVMVAKM